MSTKEIVTLKEIEHDIKNSLKTSQEIRLCSNLFEVVTLFKSFNRSSASFVIQQSFLAVFLSVGPNPQVFSQDLT